MVLFGMLLFPGSTLLLSTKYLLFLVALYFLFQNAAGRKTAPSVKTYGWLFIGTTIVFLVYAAWYAGPQYGNIILYFFIAATVGFLLSAIIPQKKPVAAPARPIVVAPTTKPAEKKTVTKTVTKIVNKSSRDDLSQIEGIGPQIRNLLEKNKIKTFDALAKAKVAELRLILEKGGERFQLHNPSSWPKQAKLAKAGKWEDLEKLQEKLDGGLTKKTKRVTGKKSAKKVAKKSAKKSTKKATKKSTKKKVARKTSTKKSSKKTAKKSTRKKTANSKRSTKKSTKKSSKKVAKKSTRKKVAKKRTAKKSSKKKAPAATRRTRATIKNQAAGQTKQAARNRAVKRAKKNLSKTTAKRTSKKTSRK
jgi:predicted flap endonuclease-1-like 5' DNA nuclease